MALVTLTPPSIEPVSLDELKAFLAIDPGLTAQDAMLSSLLTAARTWCEAYTQRRFLTTGMRLLMDFFPGYVDLRLAGSRVSSPFVSGPNAVLVGIRYAMELPYPPVQRIDLFQFVDTNGGASVLTEGTDYFADLLSQPARLTPPFGSMWPVARIVPNAVQVDYTCGYGDTADKVPEGVKSAIKLLTNYWFENRLPDQNNIPLAVKAMLGPYRDMRL
jgi:hypothetical protein